jgi:hypothetical protein
MKVRILKGILLAGISLVWGVLALASSGVGVTADEALQ